VKDKPPKFVQTIELQIGLKNYDPQKDKRFSCSLAKVMDHFHKLRGFSNHTFRLAFWLSMHKDFQDFSLEDAYANYGIQPLGSLLLILTYFSHLSHQIVVPSVSFLKIGRHLIFSSDVR
jgi:hypothetical protein